MAKQRYYAAIDLKSFYASAECVQRGLDPMKVNLVVADPERTEKTICLAVSPSLKALGVPGRPRLFEVVEKVGQLNAVRREKAPGKKFRGSSWQAEELAKDPALSIDYIVAPPQMAYYMDISARIYQVYLKYVAPEDIHVYSIDEVFIDLTPYLRLSGLSPQAFASRMVLDVFQNTGITAAVGIGTNLYLCKVAMDILAKHAAPDENGVRIAFLDELSYRRQLWDHRPLTDFWRVGRGYARKLERNGLKTMGDIARCSLGGPNDYHNEALLYKLFGINAELLIDHAWGIEPCTIAHIKAYKPSTNSVSSGQVLQSPYPYEKARLVIREMADLMALDLVEKGLMTDQVGLAVGYDIENLTDPQRRAQYSGPVVKDVYGRQVPKAVNGTKNLGRYHASATRITQAVMELCDQLMDPTLLVRRITLCANHLLPESEVPKPSGYVQLDLFSDPEADERQRQAEDAALEREQRRQKAVISIKRKYGKNAILKAMNLSDGATARDRNRQVGGHKA